MSESTPSVSLAEIEEGLLGTSIDEEKRIELLRHAIEWRKEFDLTILLRKVRQVSANQGLLEYIVRAFGYARDPGALEDVAEYLGHDRLEIVINAVKALASLDPAGATARCRSVLLGEDSRKAFAVAEVLANRCHAHAESVFIDLAFSEKGRHRALSVFYLKNLSADEMTPIVLEMLRRERKSGVRKLLIQLLSLRATSKERQSIAKLKEELQKKVAEIGAIIQKVSSAPSEPCLDEQHVSVSGRFNLADFQDSALALAETDASEPAGPLASPDPPEPPGSPAFTAFPGPLGSPESPGSQQAFERWKNQKSGRRRKTLLQVIPERMDTHRIAIAVLFILLGGIFLFQNSARESGVSEESAHVQHDSKLGNVGSRVEFQARIKSIDPDGKTLFVAHGDEFEARVYFLQWDLTGLHPDDPIEITGVMREIQSPRSFLIIGHATRKVESTDS